MRQFKEKEWKSFREAREEKGPWICPEGSWKLSYLKALSKNSKEKETVNKTIRGMKEKTQESYVQIIGTLERKKGVHGREEVL